MDTNFDLIWNDHEGNIRTMLVNIVLCGFNFNNNQFVGYVRKKQTMKITGERGRRSR